MQQLTIKRQQLTNSDYWFEIKFYNDGEIIGRHFKIEFGLGFIIFKIGNEAMIRLYCVELKMQEYLNRR